jgi:hypothetical protein
VKIIIFCKLRLAALEVHLDVPIILDLYLVGSSSPRVFAKNCFSQFSPVHELCELQRHPLNLVALGAGDAEEGLHFGRSRSRNIMRRGAQTWRSR